MAGIKIRNKQTGEIREIQASEAQNFGLDPAEALSRFKAQREIEQIESGVPEVKVKSAEAARLEGIITSGTSSLGELEGIIDPDPGKKGLEGRGELFKAKLGFGLATDEITNLSDVIGRLRSGAAINDDEEKRFRKLLPSPLKSEARIKRDIERFRNELEAVAKAAGIDISGVSERTEAQQAAQKATGKKKIGDIAVDRIQNVNTLGEQPEVAPEEDSIAREIVKDLTSPSTILSTAGDIAGEVIGVPAAAATFGVVNPITASAGLSAAGEFAGNLIEDLISGNELDFEKATKQAATAGVIAGATPAVIKVGVKAFRPLLKAPGKIIEKLIGRNLTKLGNSVLQTTGGEALERGINVFDEMGARGLAILPRKEALFKIADDLNIAEKGIKEGIEKAGNPIVMKMSELRSLFKNAIEEVLDQSDKNALANLEETVLKKVRGKDINAEQALSIKREIFRKSAGRESAANPAKNKIAQAVNDSLKTSVDAAKKGLREEEILLYMEKIFTRLRDSEFVKGNLKQFNLINPVTYINAIVGSRGVSIAGQAAEIGGRALQKPAELLPSISEKAVQRAVGLVRQPLRSLTEQ